MAEAAPVAHATPTTPAGAPVAPPELPATNSPSLAGTPAPAGDPAASGKPGDATSLAAKPAPAPSAAPAPTPFDVSKLTVPEGFELSETAAAKLSEIAKTIPGFSQEAANALLAEHAAAVKAATDRSLELWQQTKEAWVAEVKADKTIGGDKLPRTLATIAKAIDHFAGSPEEAAAVRTALNFTGSGDNPAIVRLLYRMSQALTEGGHVAGGTPSPKPRSAAEAMWPDLPSINS